MFLFFFLQREPPQCPPRPASYTPSSNNEPVAYSNTAAVALNNLDTLRSYGSAGDELEIIPPDYLRNLNRRTPVPPPSLGHSIPVGGNSAGSDNDSLHKSSWQEQMQLASFISDAAKIKNGKFDHIPFSPKKKIPNLIKKKKYLHSKRSFLLFYFRLRHVAHLLFYMKKKYQLKNDFMEKLIPFIWI